MSVCQRVSPVVASTEITLALSPPTKTAPLATTGAVRTVPNFRHHRATPVAASIDRRKPSSPPANNDPSAAAIAAIGSATSSLQRSIAEGASVSSAEGHTSFARPPGVESWRTMIAARIAATTPTPIRARPDRRVSNHAPPGPSGNNYRPGRHQGPSTIIQGSLPRIIIERRLLRPPLDTRPKEIRHAAATVPGHMRIVTTILAM